MEYLNSDDNVKIIADQINIGKSTSLGKNISITVKGIFQLGDFSRLGDNTQISGNNVIIGKHLFNSSGLRIGGGGRYHPNANFKIGDRCTIHNNFVNVCEPVEIGNDVGLSPEVSILTHGYWLSVLEGYPASAVGVKIGNGVIIGYRSLVMMGVSIANEIVVGAQSVVTKPLLKKGIYAGSPAKMIKENQVLDRDERVRRIEDILARYANIAQYHSINPKIKLNYPTIFINDLALNVETFEFSGIEDVETDDFRDYIRKWGIRVYTDRPFRSHFSF
jgi:acetyltransferase-like isoleucine patch superfamily enzyme